MAPQSEERCKWRVVEGVNCIVWLANTTSRELSSITKKVLKKEKHELGTRNLNVPVLDTMKTGKYCDIIIHSDQLNHWGG